MIEQIHPTAVTKQLNRQLAGCRFEVDADNSTVTFYSDRGRRHGEPLRLHAGGDPEGLARVIRAEYPATDDFGWFNLVRIGRLWLLDGNGQILARSGGYPQGTIDKVWSDQAMAPLRAVGVSIEDRHYRSPRAANAEFRGGFPMWWVGSARGSGLGVVVTVVLIALAVLILNLAG